MFRSERSREQFAAPETRRSELKNREKSFLERVASRGKDWMKVIGLAALSTALVEGALAREARADDVAVKNQVNLLAEKSGQPTPFHHSGTFEERLTNLDDLTPNTPEDKSDALTPRLKKLNTPGVGVTRELTSGVDLHASLDPKKEGAYALLTINADFL